MRPEDKSAAPKARFPGIQCLLQQLVQVGCADNAALHGREHLDLGGRSPVIAGEFCAYQLRNDRGGLFCKKARFRLQALFLKLRLHIHEEEIAFGAVPDIRHFACVDPVRVHNDPAFGSLPEDPCKADDRKAVRFNDVPQDISRTDAGQLVNVPDQDQSHGIRDGLQEVVHEQEVDHGTFVHDQHVAFQRILFISLVAFRRLYFQKTVDCLCFQPGGFGKAFRRPSRGSRQQDLCAGFPEGGDDTEGRGGLAGPGAAGQDKDLALYGRQDRLHLDVVILHAGPEADTCRKSRRVRMDPAGIGIDRRQPFCRADFGKIKGRKIDGFFRDVAVLCIFGKGNRLCDHILHPDHFIQRDIQEIFLHGKQLRPGLYKHVPGRVAVPFVGKPVQGIEDAASQAGIFFMAEPHLLRDGIRRPETDAPDVICQTVGIFLHDFDALASVGLEDLRRMAGGNVVALQEKHDILDLFLLLPALFDAFHTDPADAGHLQETVRCFFDHIQRIRSELPHDAACKFGADAFYKTAPQILFNAVDGCRERLFKSFHGKLAAIPAVDAPGAAKIQDTAHMHVRHGAHDRYQVLVPFCPALDDRVAVLRILIGDAFYDAPQVFHIKCSSLFNVRYSARCRRTGSTRPGTLQQRRMVCPG